ncbi:MAG: sigma-54-dependent Fis family transcriptional regulator [Ignavibacteria bacterium]|nr:sigma-54-dependent Fis family transcriptional regulator [Ignavibacteria bacterium]
MIDDTAPYPEYSLAERLQFQKRHGIIGRSVEMRELVDTVIQVAPSDITVLITGESGTGKEVIAHAIHAASRRAERKFIAVNCGAIPEGILESELFGHEKGSFTGAGDMRKGYFEIADGGTIFLDEIGDTPIQTQVKLLRVLENGDFMRVGSSEQRRTNVRVITATNKDLEQEVQARRFRQDLYYRLRSVNIRIPPLRARRADIPLLVEAFLAEARVKDPTNTLLLTDDAMAALMRHSWPGNIRELRNLIESLAVLEHGRVVDESAIRRYVQGPAAVEDDRPLPMLTGRTPEQAEREVIFRALWEIRSGIDDVKNLIERLATRTPASLPPAMDPGRQEEPLVDDLSLEEIMKGAILGVLQRFDGNRRLAAKSLQISERTLYRKLQEYGL